MPLRNTPVKSRTGKRKERDDHQVLKGKLLTGGFPHRDNIIPGWALEKRLHSSQLIVYFDKKTCTYIPGLITNHPMVSEQDASGHIQFLVKAVLFDGKDTQVTVSITPEHMVQFTREAVTNPNPRIPDWREMTVVFPFGRSDPYPAEILDRALYVDEKSVLQIDSKVLTFDRPPEVHWIQLRKPEIEDYLKKRKQGQSA